MSDDPIDPADFGCRVPFPDQSPSFVHGFEAGMLWGKMTTGKDPIDSDLPYHADNRAVFERMAAAEGYVMEWRPCDGLDEWAVATFTKRRPTFTVIDGGRG